MVSNKMFLAVSLFLSSQGALAGAEALNAEYLFVPNGYDDNDTVEVVLDGYLDSTCLTPTKPLIETDWVNRTVSVTAMANRGEHVCMPVRVRYTQVAKIGVFPHGEFKIVTNGGNMLSNLTVTEAQNAGPDDYRYAEIKEVWVDYAPDLKNSQYSAILEGFFENTCYVWGDIEVINSGDTIEILPKLVQQGEICLPIYEPFVKRVFLPRFAGEKTRKLVHVRSKNGQSLNEVFSTY